MSEGEPTIGKEIRLEEHKHFDFAFYALSIIAALAFGMFCGLKISGKY